MSEGDKERLREQYDDCSLKINNLANLIKNLSNEYDLDNLQEIVNQEDYLNLLANCLYSVNSLTYAYCNLKSIQFPAEFSKVKQYYTKAKNPMATEATIEPGNSNSTGINKQAVKRIIERSIK